MPDSSEQKAKVVTLDPPTHSDDVNRTFDWKSLKDNALQQSDELSHVYFSMRAIELVAKAVREARLEAGLSQVELANLAKVSQAQLSRLERAADAIHDRTRDTDRSESAPTAAKKRIDGPTIGVVGRVLAAAGYKISEVKLEKCRSKK